MNLPLHVMQQPGAYMLGDLPLGVRRDGDTWMVNAFRRPDVERWMAQAQLAGVTFLTRREAVQAVQVAIHAHGAPPSFSNVRLRRGRDGVYRSDSGLQVTRRKKLGQYPAGWTVSGPQGDPPLFVRSLAEARRAVRFLDERNPAADKAS